MDYEDSFDGSAMRGSSDHQTNSLTDVAEETERRFNFQKEERNLSGLPLNDTSQDRERNRSLARSFDIIRRLKKETA
jgi:hypothetical protein